MTVTTNPERIRLNLAVSKSVKERLDQLQELSEAGNVTEVIRRALAVYELLLQVRKSGGKILIQDAQGNVEGLRII